MTTGAVAIRPKAPSMLQFRSNWAQTPLLRCGPGMSEIAGGTSLPATPANSRNAHAHNSRELELDEHEDTVSLYYNVAAFS